MRPSSLSAKSGALASWQFSLSLLNSKILASAPTYAPVFGAVGVGRRTAGLAFLLVILRLLRPPRSAFGRLRSSDNSSNARPGRY
jgi:hypothetical protein